MIILLADWSKAYALGKIYILPGEMNAYYRKFEPKNDARFKARYNGTARSLGFKKDEETGLYAFDLDESMAAK